MGQGSWVCVPAHSSGSAQSSPRGVPLGRLCLLKSFVRERLWVQGGEGREGSRQPPSETQWSFLLAATVSGDKLERERKEHDS